MGDICLQLLESCNCHSLVVSKFSQNCPRRIATRVILGKPRKYKRKLILNCPRTHAISLTNGKRENEKNKTLNRLLSSFCLLKPEYLHKLRTRQCPPPGVGPLKGVGGGGLQGFGVNGKVVNITVHHQYRSPPGYWAPEGGWGGDYRVLV